MALNVERRLAVPEHLDFTGAVGLDPHRRVVRAGVADDGSQDEFGHGSSVDKGHFSGALNPAKIRPHDQRLRHQIQLLSAAAKVTHAR